MNWRSRGSSGAIKMGESWLCSQRLERVSRGVRGITLRPPRLTRSSPSCLPSVSLLSLPAEEPVCNQVSVWTRKV